MPSPSDDDPQLLMIGTGPCLSEKAVRVGPDSLEIKRQPQVRRRARQAGKVVIERKRAPAVDTNHLEYAVPPDQALVRGGDHRLLHRHDLAVQRG
jgi:hypothetical protein